MAGRANGRRSVTRGLAVALLVTLLASACGADDEAAVDEAAEASATEPEASSEPTDEGEEDPDTPAETEPVTVRVGFNPFWSVPPLFVGRELGYFDELGGVDVEWLEFEAPNAALAALAAGDVDVLATPGPSLLQARANGIDAVGVASLAGESDPAQYGFVARTDSGLEDVGDLVGTTVGVNNFAGNFDLHLRYMLEQQGIDPETDVSITVTPISAVIPAVSDGSLDSGAIVGAGMLFVEADPELGIVLSSRDVPDIAGEYSFMILAMSRDMVTTNRDAAVEFMTAYARAVDFIVDDPQEAAALWAANSGVDVMVNMREMNEFPDGGHAQMAGLEFDQRLLLEYGYIEAEQDLAEVLDPSLLDEARALVDAQ